MFDDPGKELQKLQERLLEAENEPEAVPDLPEPALSSDLPDAGEEPKNGRIEGRRRIGWLAAALLLEAGALLALLAWWLQWKS